MAFHAIIGRVEEEEEAEEGVEVEEIDLTAKNEAVSLYHKVKEDNH